MKNRETSLSKHCRDARQTNSIEFDREFQAVHTFAMAKHLLKCYPPSSAEGVSQLSRMVEEYQGRGLPSIDLAAKLTPYIGEFNLLQNSDDIHYIETCYQRYFRGIPIHLGRLMKCQTKLMLYKNSYDKLVEKGLITIGDGGDSIVSDLHFFLSPREWITWPKTENGELTLDINALSSLRMTIAQTLYKALTYERNKGLLNFNVNHRGLHYEYCNPFAASSGREAPKGNSFVYLPSKLRHYLLAPKKGKQIFILDYCSQEPACLAAMSGDSELWGAYQQGDLYENLKARDNIFSSLSRKEFKTLCISHLYGITPKGIEDTFSVTKVTAIQWNSALRKILWKINHYLDEKVKQAFSQGYADVFGFRRTVAADTRISSIRNFFVQAVCAYMLRKICLKLDQLKIPLLFAIHDCAAVEISAQDEETKPLVAQVMADVSESILGQGYRLRTECEYHKKNIN